MTAPSVTAAAPGQPVAPPKRRWRNYLLDPKFQLKYTGLILAVAVVLLVGLGVVILSTANVAAQQAESAVRQAAAAMRESNTSSQIVRMQQVAEAQNNPELVQTITDELHRADRQSAQNVANIQAQSAGIERNRRLTRYALVGSGLVFLFLLGMAGIVITHKVVGPVFKMKRLLRQVGTGRLVMHEGLRRGDELGDLFETFVQTVTSLRQAREAEIVALDAAIREVETTEPGSPAALAKLRAVRAQLQLTVADAPRGAPAGP